MNHLKLFKSFLLTLIAAMLPQLAIAYDFMVDGLCYNIISDSEAQVTCELPQYINATYYSVYSNLYGDLVIPKNVSYDGKTYMVTSIDGNAFWNCSNLTSVTIPNTVTSIQNNVFVNCSGITSFLVENGNLIYDSRNNCMAIIEKETNTLIAGCKNTIIPNSVTTIGVCAFMGCSGLTSVTIPNSVTEIGGDAFRSCSGLTSVTIPNSVTSIGVGAFQDCSGLTSVIIGNSVTTIGGYAFAGCANLNSISIGNSITEFGYWNVFGNCPIETLTLTGKGASNIENADNYSRTRLGKAKIINIGSQITSIGIRFYNDPNVINCYANIPPSCTSNTFSSYDGELHVPSASAVAYFTADYWQNFNILVNDLTDKVSLDKAEASLVQWEKLALNATVIPDESNVIWDSTNPSIATVDENGIVTALKEGECDIYATFASNPAVYATCHITTSYPDISLSLSEESLGMNVGDEQTLILTIIPDNTGLTPTWASSNESVAKVENGVVSAIGEGECDITAKVLDKTVICHVTVSGNVILSLNIENAILGANQILTVYPTCTPDVPVELVVTSSDPSIAMARVVNRTNAPYLGVTSFPEKDMAMNLMEQLAASGESKAPALASTKAIMIVGVQNGTATITVTTADGKATPAIIELRVVDVNSDNVVTAADVTALYDYLLNEDLTYYDTSDINGDGNITAADITAVYNLLLGN